VLPKKQGALREDADPAALAMLALSGSLLPDGCLSRSALPSYLLAR
jgi:hypothetical protein